MRIALRRIWPPIKTMVRAWRMETKFCQAFLWPSDVNLRDKRSFNSYISYFTCSLFDSLSEHHMIISL